MIIRFNLTIGDGKFYSISTSKKYYVNYPAISGYPYNTQVAYLSDMSILQFFISPPKESSSARLAESLRGKTVLITGASFGIGEATARLLAPTGATLLLAARTKEKLEALAHDIGQAGGKAFIYCVDLSKLDDVKTFAHQIENDHPRIDIIISNAGKSIRRPITESFERNDLERLVGLNFLGPSTMLCQLLPRIIKQGGGHVINVSTVSARLLAAPRWSAYQSSKTGFDVWLRSIANELRPRHVFASSVYLPLVRTRMSSASRVFDSVPALSAEAAAQVIAYAIVRKHDRVAPWWLRWAEFGSFCFERLANRTLTLLFRRSHDQIGQKIPRHQGKP
jgi:short-subunit dehydrogenase